MKNFINFFLRFAVGIIVGGSLLFGQDSETLLLKSIGLLFTVSGACTIGAYCWRNFRGSKEIAPLSGYAAGLMGILMFFHSKGFQTFVPILLGLLLLLLSFYQLYLLICLRLKKNQIYFLFYLVSFILVLYGVRLIFVTEVEVLVSLRTMREVLRAISCSSVSVGSAFFIYSINEMIIAIMYFQPLFVRKEVKTESKSSAETITTDSPTVDANNDQKTLEGDK